ncbi:MAG: DNA polymerase III subunit [Moraxella sp.]|uniref:DNA polymerase III subunit n=1 Tax=Moraxella sp. TaxID=479 RepID=UPI0026DD6364|nr:DNA polymerase III subunit [Moraxella sp.]MDO4450798.1 DNA polymerase III subunit [Moraxella sp.]
MTDQIKHDLPYFSPLLSWQIKAWEQVTHQFNDGKLPHGLLASGMAGIGKRDFVWRLVAWLLCHDKAETGACGACESCTWLRAGTHPDVMVLPATSLLTSDDTEQMSIKIDDVRALQEYSHVKGQGVRLIVLDHAETLTLGAGNALLKTLEEPRAGVHLLLISDNPSKLLPTIKSRVQALPLGQIDYGVALSYVADKLGDESLACLALDLADGAVLRAVELPSMAWFDKRTLWLKTWLSLRHGQRLPVSASDYWQGVLDLADFIVLTRLMLMDVVRVGMGLGSRHTDIDVAGLIGDDVPSLVQVENFLATLDDVAAALAQNVQDKMAYDKIFYELVNLS